MKRFKIVVLDKLVEISDIERNVLSEIGAEIFQYDVKTDEEILKVASDSDAILNTCVMINREVLSRLKKCKVIGRYGVGLDCIDLKAATEYGIVVSYAPIYCQDEVAAQTLCLMLACERRTIEVDKVIKSGRWIGNKVVKDARSTQGKTYGLVGFGAIARKVADLVKPHGVNIIAYDPFINDEVFEMYNIKRVDLEYLLSVSDYISLHVPLLEDTKHMINAERLALMKDDAILINTARGGLIDQEELVKVMKKGKLSAAGLDVLENEPPLPDDPILTIKNVITTGHTGATTIESFDRLRKIVAQGVLDVLSGKWPKYIGNPEIKNKITLE